LNPNPFRSTDGSAWAWQARCAAVVPCFNEAANIENVVTRVRFFLPTVIVVDDGSTDATADIARRAGAEVLRLPANHGKGCALRHGWRRAQELGFAWVLMMDGDGQHAAADIPKFLASAEMSGAALVVGNRMADCQVMPWLRRRVNRWMSRRLSRLTGVFLPDSQCGFRLAHLETLRQLPLRVNRFEIESAMLAKLIAAGEKVEFVSVQTIYRTGASKIRPLQDSWRWLRWRRTAGSSVSPIGALQIRGKEGAKPALYVSRAGAL
jgi:glycosyltransferase involved in cell wall biosynthesis